MARISEIVDLQKVDKYTGEGKVLSVASISDRLNVVEIEGISKKALCWKDNCEKWKVEPQSESELEIEVKEGTDRAGNPENKLWLNRFGAKQEGRRGSQGGRGGYIPKEFYQELAPSIGGIYHHGIDNGLSLVDIEEHALSYANVMAKVKGQDPFSRNDRPRDPETKTAPTVSEPKKAEPKTEPKYPGAGEYVKSLGIEAALFGEFKDDCEYQGEEWGAVVLALKRDGLEFHNPEAALQALVEKLEIRVGQREEPIGPKQIEEVGKELVLSPGAIRKLKTFSDLPGPVRLKEELESIGDRNAINDWILKRDEWVVPRLAAGAMPGAA